MQGYSKVIVFIIGVQRNKDKKEKLSEEVLRKTLLLFPKGIWRRLVSWTKIFVRENMVEWRETAGSTITHLLSTFPKLDDCVFFQTLPYIRADSSEWKLMLLFTSLIFYEGSMDLRETEGFQSFLLPEMMDIRSGSNNPHRNFMTIF